MEERQVKYCRLRFVKEMQEKTVKRRGDITTSNVPSEENAIR